MPTDAIFGPLTGTPQVEFAVLNTLEAWLPYMLRILERRLTLPAGTLTDPPSRSSYFGGIDFESWDGDCLPNIIAVVKPDGEADRTTSGYAQWFDVQVAAVVNTQTEDESRILAGHIGTAIVASLAQHGDLGGIATMTQPVSAAAPEFVDPAKRTQVRAVVSFRTYVEGLVNDLAGLKVLPPDSPQYPGDPDQPFEDWPARTETNVVVTALDD